MATPLNIALISREYPPFFGGGIGSYTLRWSRVLAGAGHRVVVITASYDGREYRERDGEVVVVRYPLVRGDDWSGPDPAIADSWTRAAFGTFSPVSVFAMQVAAALPALAEEFELDVVEAPDTGALHWFALNARRTGQVFRERGPVFITCIHSPTAWIARWNRAPLRTRQDRELAAMEAECARWSDGLVCPSGAMRDEASALWGLDDGGFAVIPYPLGELEVVARGMAGVRDRVCSANRGGGAGGTESSHPDRGADLGGAARMLYAGRLEPRKGIDTLLDGLGWACRERAPIELHLAGEDMPDPERPGTFGANSVQWLVPAEFRGCVRMHGKLTPEALASLQLEADAIVVPSPMDNFPNACMEAMAMGKVVIAADAGGMAEMIEHSRSGLLFRPSSPESCGEMLGWAAHMTARVRSEIGAAAAARILEICGNDRVLGARVRHYRSVLAARTDRGRGRERRAVVVVDDTCGSDVPAAIEGAVTGDPGVGFAHGWVSRGARAIVRGTPTALSLADGDAAIGPLAVAEDALSPAVLAHLKATEHPGRYIAPETRLVAALLVDLGLGGAVVPEARAELAPEPPGAGALELAELRSAREELGRIHASRGWRWLGRIYAVLHVLKGRGLRDGGTYDPATPEDALRGRGG
jgi:glycosyltransferase involved in cell wall biosynthesis